MNSISAILEGLNRNKIDEGKRRENFVGMGLDKDEILPYIYRSIEFGDEDDVEDKVFYYRGELLNITKGKSNPALKRLEQDIKKAKTSQDLYDITTRLEMVTMW